MPGDDNAYQLVQFTLERIVRSREDTCSGGGVTGRPGGPVTPRRVVITIGRGRNIKKH